LVLPGKRVRAVVRAASATAAAANDEEITPED
jgi:hypothetical protein